MAPSKLKGLTKHYWAALLIMLPSMSWACLGEFPESYCEIASGYTAKVAIPYLVDSEIRYERGTGVIIRGDGYLLTAAHLFKKAHEDSSNNPSYWKTHPVIVTMNAGSLSESTFYAKPYRVPDYDNDIAMLMPLGGQRIFIPNPARLCNSKIPLQNKKIRPFIAFGFPGNSPDLKPTVGHTNGVDRPNLVGVEASFYFGMSGAPAINLDGELIGLVQGGTEADILKSLTPLTHARPMYFELDVTDTCKSEADSVVKQSAKTFIDPRDDFLSKGWRALSAGWVTSFSTSQMSIFVENDKAKVSYLSSFVIRNEGDRPLSKLVFSDIRVNRISRLKVRISEPRIGEVEKTLEGILDMASFQSAWTADKLDLLSAASTSFSSVTGLTLGRLDYAMSEHARLMPVQPDFGVGKLVAENTTLRIDDLRTKVNKDESVIVTIEIELEQMPISEFVKEIPSRLGHLTPYPARMANLSVKLLRNLDDETETITLGDFGNYVELGDGEQETQYDGTLFEFSDHFALASHFFLPQHARQELRWRWVLQ